jgi:hypothetical protein
LYWILVVLFPFCGRPPASRFTVAKPDTPNFSIPTRIAFGVVAVVMIACMLRYFGIL